MMRSSLPTVDDRRPPLPIVLGFALTCLVMLVYSSIPVVEQYFDFCLAVGDGFYIMDRGSIVAEGPNADSDDDIVKRHITV